MEVRADDRQGWISNNPGVYREFDKGLGGKIPFSSADHAWRWSGLSVCVTLKAKDHELIHGIGFFRPDAGTRARSERRQAPG